MKGNGQNMTRKFKVTRYPKSASNLVNQHVAAHAIYDALRHALVIAEQEVIGTRARLSGEKASEAEAILAGGKPRHPRLPRVRVAKQNVESADLAEMATTTG
jgi:hypothetical protein